MKNKKNVLISIFAVATILIIILILIFTKINYKKENSGNNMSNETLEEILNYICNISSYDATMEVTINSNKNTNKYIIKQKYSQTEQIQEVLEPNNIKGVKFIYKDGTLEVQNSQLELTKIYNYYPYLEDNNLWLNSFIKEFKNMESKNKSTKKENNTVTLRITTNSDKIKYKTLYFDAVTGEPTKLVIEDNNKKEIIYILYSEISTK